MNADAKRQKVNALCAEIVEDLCEAELDAILLDPEMFTIRTRRRIAMSQSVGFSVEPKALSGR